MLKKKSVKYVRKRITVILLLILSLLLTSCKEHVWTIEKKMDEIAEEIMEAIIEEDSNSLFEFFASDIQDNHKDQTLEEIQQAFDFIDGKIISYDYHPIPGRRAQSYGIIEKYDCRPEFRNVTTDTGNTYTMQCTYHYIWDTQPEREGLTKIIIFKDNDRDNQVQIGRNYSVRE